MDGWNPAKMGATGTSNFDVWATFTSGGSLITRQIQGDGIDQHLAYVTSSNAYWYLADHLGSTRGVIDNSGTVQDSIVYDAYGNITSQSNDSAATLYTYTGRELDVETGLQYNRARWYDPGTGRWITQDPMGFDAGDSNLYRYVHDAPLTALDASGLDWVVLSKRIRVAGNLADLNKMAAEGTPYTDVAKEWLKVSNRAGGQFAVYLGKELPMPTELGVPAVADNAQFKRGDVGIPADSIRFVYMPIMFEWDIYDDNGNAPRIDDIGVKEFQVARPNIATDSSYNTNAVHIDPNFSPLVGFSRTFKLREKSNGRDVFRIIRWDAPGFNLMLKDINNWNGKKVAKSDADLSVYFDSYSLRLFKNGTFTMVKSSEITGDALYMGATAGGRITVLLGGPDLWNGKDNPSPVEYSINVAPGATGRQYKPAELGPPM